MNLKVRMLEDNGEIVTSEAGNSMLPIIKSKQKHKLKACKWEDCEVDDIVYCKVHGRYITHKVFAKNNERGLLIGNNKGYKNGWTKSVYGKVVEIY
jgi:hypothetical protein